MSISSVSSASVRSTPLPKAQPEALEGSEPENDNDQDDAKSTTTKPANTPIQTTNRPQAIGSVGGNLNLFA